MLKQYDDLDTRLIEEYGKHIYSEARLNYFASEVMEILAIDDADEIATSLSRAFQACGTLHLSFNNNFKKVYRYDGENMIADWKISSLACYLIVINSNPANEHVARAQLYFATKVTTGKVTYGSKGF